MTPAGTSNELDVQNEWEENTHTHSEGLLLSIMMRPDYNTVKKSSKYDIDYMAALEPDVQNKWDDNSHSTHTQHTQHTHTARTAHTHSTHSTAHTHSTHNPFILDARFVWTHLTCRGHTGGRSHAGFLHLPSAVLPLIFLARRIQPFLSLVDREVEFSVLTI